MCQKLDVTQVMQQRRKRSKGEPNLKSKAACQWLANWRATASSQSQLARQWPAVSGISPTGEQLARALRCCAFQSDSQHIKRANGGISKGGRKNTTWGTSRALLGGLKSLKNLGISWESSGEAWRDLGIPHLWLYLSPYSSPLFNALFHSFRVCFICIYV